MGRNILKNVDVAKYNDKQRSKVGGKTEKDDVCTRPAVTANEIKATTATNKNK